MTNPYFFPLTDAVLTGPNRSMCRSSNGLEEETTFLDLNAGLENLPFSHASQRESDLYFRFGSPLTRFSLLIREIFLKLACPNLMCQTHCSSETDIRQVTFCFSRSEKSIL